MSSNQDMGKNGLIESLISRFHKKRVTILLHIEYNNYI
jgi:hypothetical protein